MVARVQSLPCPLPHLCLCTAPLPVGSMDTWTEISASPVSVEGSEFSVSVIWIGHPAIHSRRAAMEHLPNHLCNPTAEHVDAAGGHRRCPGIVPNDGSNRHIGQQPLSPSSCSSGNAMDPISFPSLPWSWPENADLWNGGFEDKVHLFEPLLR